MSFQMKLLAVMTKHMKPTANRTEQTTFAVYILTEWRSTALSLVVFAVSMPVTSSVEAWQPHG